MQEESITSPTSISASATTTTTNTTVVVLFGTTLTAPSSASNHSEPYTSSDISTPALTENSLPPTTTDTNTIQVLSPAQDHQDTSRATREGAESLNRSESTRGVTRNRETTVTASGLVAESTSSSLSLSSLSEWTTRTPSGPKQAISASQAHSGRRSVQEPGVEPELVSSAATPPQPEQAARQSVSSRTNSTSWVHKISRLISTSAENGYEQPKGNQEPSPRIEETVWKTRVPSVQGFLNSALDWVVPSRTNSTQPAIETEQETPTIATSSVIIAKLQASLNPAVPTAIPQTNHLGLSPPLSLSSSLSSSILPGIIMRNSGRDREREYRHPSPEIPTTSSSSRLRQDRYADFATMPTRHNTVPPPQSSSSRTSFDDMRLSSYARGLEEKTKTLEKALKESQSRLRARETDLRSLEGVLRNRDDELRGRDSQLRNLEVELREVESELKSKETEVRSLKGSVNGAASDYNYYSGNSLASSSARESHHLPSTSPVANKLESTIRVLDAQLRSKELDVKEKDDELRRLESSLRSKAGELKQYQLALRTKEGELEKLKREWGRERKEREGYVKELEVELDLNDVNGEHQARSSVSSRSSSSVRKRSATVVDPNAESAHMADLRRRASVSPLIHKKPGSSSPKTVHSRHSSLDLKTDSTSKMSTSAPSSNGFSPGQPPVPQTHSSKPDRTTTGTSPSSSSSSSASSRSSRSTVLTTPTPAIPKNLDHATPTPNQPPPLPKTTVPPAPPPPAPPPLPPPHLPTALVLPSSTLSEQLALHRSSETFLTRTDTWSGAQVLQAVHDINSQILQFAASATEMCRFTARDVGSPPPSPAANAQSSSSSSAVGKINSAVRNSRGFVETGQRLGPPLTQLLGTYDHSNDPILVQLALQTCVCVASKKAWESFCLGLPGKSDGVLGVIYRSLKELEPQPTSAKWRALTHSHIHAIYPTLSTYSATELAETILRWVFDILVLAGCVSIDCGGTGGNTPTGAASSSSSFPSPSSPTGASTSTISLPLSLQALHSRSTLLPQLTHITTALTKLENVLRQDILSTSFDLIIPEFGRPFARVGMSDAFVKWDSGGMPAGSGSAEGQPSSGKVLGCVEIGLACRTRLGFRGPPPSPVVPLPPNATTVENAAAGKQLLNGNGNANSMLTANGVQVNGGAGQVQNGQKPEAVFEERMLLLPKVVLESVVEML
ncbi:hypothetical protein FA15DRAFT_695436 [Coprinopsis marcescibilis]|uniref:Uncharacterized protein n=1 Tax=Coprinopsis marcescibilis TaxID=230819 RepID=A0A5C3L3X5_COPMA|nr:hypothetical protein FA15DRAFT_695436 [Coprinopsis marcescibilis]